MTEPQPEELDILKHVSKYERLRPLYDRLANEVRDVLEKKLKATNVRVAQILDRAKTVESFKEKCERKNYKTPLEDATDLAGVRVVCYYESDLVPIKEIITATFHIHETVDKTRDLGVDKMGTTVRVLLSVWARATGVADMMASPN